MEELIKVIDRRIDLLELKINESITDTQLVYYNAKKEELTDLRDYIILNNN